MNPETNFFYIYHMWYFIYINNYILYMLNYETDRYDFSKQSSYIKFTQRGIMQHVDQAGVKGIHSAKITILTCTNSVASRVSEESSSLMTSRIF